MLGSWPASQKAAYLSPLATCAPESASTAAYNQRVGVAGAQLTILGQSCHRHLRHFMLLQAGMVKHVLLGQRGKLLPAALPHSPPPACASSGGKETWTLSSGTPFFLSKVAGPVRTW